MFHKTKPYVNIKCKIAHEKKLTKTLSETNPKIWIIPGTWVKRLLFYFIIFNHIKKNWLKPCSKPNPEIRIIPGLWV